MLRINLPYPPSANRIWRTSNGRTYLSQAAKAWKKEAGWLARKEKAEKLTGAVSVEIWLHPKLTKKGEASKARLDLDNTIKITLDALNGIAWDDDSQVKQIHAQVVHPADGGGLTVFVLRAE